MLARAPAALQRQPAAPPAGPPAPTSTSVVHEGLRLTPDNSALRIALEQRIAAKGWDDTYGWATRFINMTPEQGIRLQIGAAADPQVISDIQKRLNTEIDKFQTEVQDYIKNFGPKAEGVTREVLQNSEDQIKDQLKKLGVHEDTIFGIGLGTQSMDKEKGKQLQAMAKELAAKRRATNKADNEYFNARDQITELVNKSGAPALTAVITDLVASKEQTDRAEQLRNTALQMEDEYFNLCKLKEQENPILAAYTTGNDAAIRLEDLANKSAGDLTDEVTLQAQERLRNIKEVRDQLGGRYSIWKNTNILRITKQKEHATPWQARVVDDNGVKVQADAADNAKLLAAVAIGLGLLAAIPTGGSSVVAGIAAAAAISGAAITLYGAYEKLQEMSLESAAQATDFDKAKAISQGEPPEYIWLAMDVVAAITDIKAAATAFKTLAELVEAARAAKTAEKVTELAEAGKKFGLNEAAQARLAAAVGDAENVAAQVEAVGAAFRKADMAAVAKRIEDITGKNYARVFQKLQSAGKVHPLTEEGMIAALGESRARNIIASKKWQSWGGFYDPKTGYIFVKPGSVDYVAANVIHESVHAVQAAVGDNVISFMAEFEAFSAERIYLQRLQRSGGKIPNNLNWLVNEDHEAISKFIEQRYGYKAPESLDLTEIIEGVLRKMEKF